MRSCVFCSPARLRNASLQVKEVALIHPGRPAEVAAAENAGQLGGDVGVVVTDASGLAQGVDLDAQVGERVATRGVDRARDGRRQIAAVRQVQRLALGFGQEPVGVQHNAVVGAEVAQLLCVQGGGRHLCEADGLEDLAQIGRRVGVCGVHVRAEVAPHHLLAAAPGGDDADTGLDQAYVSLGVGDDAGGSQAESPGRRLARAGRARLPPAAARRAARA